MGRLIYLALLSHIAVTQKLQVTVSDVSAQLHEDVLMPCRVTGYRTPELDLPNVGVKWSFRSQNETEEEVYSFNGAEHKASRVGAQITEKELRKGNATLFIPQIKLSDAGRYKCTVFVWSNKAEGGSSLSVLANPKVTLSSSAISVKVGDERSISCAVSQFYPENIEVQWFELSNDKVSSVAGDICTGALVDNPDGTFNVTSRLRLRPTLEDNEKRYQCTVEHKTLPQNFSVAAALSVTERQSWMGIIIGCIAGVVAAAVAVIAIVVYAKFFKTVPPKLTDISLSERLVHMEKASISFQVTGFRPQILGIRAYLTCKDCIPKRIFHWTSTETGANGHLQTPNGRDEFELLIHGEEESPFIFNLSEFEKHKDNTFSISCNIAAFLDLYQHNGAMLKIQVFHKGHTSPAAEKEVELHVVGVAPRLSKVFMPRSLVQHEDCALTCLISCFKPRGIQIIWSRSQNGCLLDIAEATFQIEANNAEKLRERNGYTHSISEAPFPDRTHCITITPVLNPIQYVRSPEGHITLECKIHSFFPGDIEIFWLKDGVRNTPEITDIKTELGLFYCVSKFTFLPSQRDQGKTVTCSIKHASLKEPKEVVWRMIPIVVPPRISEISSDPLYPELGKPVTLSCGIEEFFPEKCTVMWQIGDSVRHSECEINEGNPVINPDTGLFNSKTSITFKARREDHDKLISVSVLHYATMVMPERKQHHFLLKGVPRVSDIIFEPPFFGYGQLISLICDVTGFYPNDITAEWYTNGMKLDNITNIGSGEDENGLFHLKSSLHIRPTALYYNKDISFLVSHPSLREPIKKQVAILLPALPPNVSEFLMIPSQPEVNKPLILRVCMADYAPGYIQVRWFKSSRCFEEEVSSTEPQIATNALCFSESQVQFIPRMNDHNCQLRCEVEHPESGKITEKSCTLVLKGTTIYCDSSLYETDGPFGQTKEQRLSPLRQSKEELLSQFEEAGVLKIQCSTKNPRAGEDVILCCKVPGCYSNDTDIYWYKGMYPVNSRNIRNEDFEGGCISYVTIETNEAEDECNIRCEVISDEPRQDACYTLKLQKALVAAAVC
ncbi:uncharacterized protein [Pleurodeles waltl]|uniref:uncharacterized protein isoform X2 n=1 Tax=Pleurodeles waltl TaxID=8319 RepID=UPI0037099B2D